MTDFSERLDGPALIALGGNDQPDSPFPLGTREYDWHRHRRGQLFCVESGLVHVRTRHGSWLLPPHRAGWIPPGVSHWIDMRGALAGWGLLITPAASLGLPAEPCVIGVNDLLRALVQRAAGWAERDALSDEQSRIVAVLLDELRHARREPLHLPMPVDERLRRISQWILQQPGDGGTLEALARRAGLSERTARRLFLSETGMKFTHWRQQALLCHALERLAGGDSVAVVADALGYATPSNFIAMFRRALGDSPASYFAKRRAT